MLPFLLKEKKKWMKMFFWLSLMWCPWGRRTEDCVCCQQLVWRSVRCNSTMIHYSRYSYSMLKSRVLQYVPFRKKAQRERVWLTANPGSADATGSITSAFKEVAAEGIHYWLYTGLCVFCRRKQTIWCLHSLWLNIYRSIILSARKRLFFFFNKVLNT